MTTKVDAPAELGSEALRLWEDVTSSYGLRPDERRILEDACREIDIIERLQREVSKPNFALTAKGSMGQRVSNPILGELKGHRALLASLLKQLKLTDLAEGAGRSSEPAEPSDASNAARKAAITRWGRQG